MSQDKIYKSIKTKLPKAEIFDAEHVDDVIHKGQFYTYVQYRPTGEPFYVGKGIGLRYADWARHNKRYINVIKKYGVENIKTALFPVSSEDQAFEWEVDLIYKFSSEGVDLVNIAYGGRGWGDLIRHGISRKTINEYIKYRMSLMTPEQKAEIYNEDRNSRVSNSLKNKSPEEKAETGRQGWETRRKNDTLERKEKRHLAGIRAAQTRLKKKPKGSEAYKEQGRKAHQTRLTSMTLEESAASYAKGVETKRKKETLETKAQQRVAAKKAAQTRRARRTPEEFKESYVRAAAKTRLTKAEKRKQKGTLQCT